MVLGKVSEPGRPNLDHSRAKAYCACSRCGWGLFGHSLFRLSFLSFFSFPWETAYKTKILSQRAIKQPFFAPLSQKGRTFIT